MQPGLEEDHRTAEDGSEALWDWEWARCLCLKVARKLTCDADEAEDVAQNAVLRAWRNHQSTEVTNRSAWLTRIARNEAARVRTRRSPILSTESAEAQLSADVTARGRPSGDPGDHLERLDLRSALAALGAADRLLLKLRYDEDLTQPVIASRLGVPEGTAKVRLHRARKELRSALGNS